MRCCCPHSQWRGRSNISGSYRRSSVIGGGVSKTPATSETTYISIWKSDNPQLVDFPTPCTMLLTIDGGGNRYTAGCSLMQVAEVIGQFLCLPLFHEREVFAHKHIMARTTRYTRLLIFNIRREQVTMILLPRRPACDNIQKSPLERGLARVLSATQPAGRFPVLPPQSLVLMFSAMSTLI